MSLYFSIGYFYFDGSTLFSLLSFLEIYTLLILFMAIFYHFRFVTRVKLFSNCIDWIYPNYFVGIEKHHVVAFI